MNQQQNQKVEKCDLQEIKGDINLTNRFQYRLESLLNNCNEHKKSYCKLIECNEIDLSRAEFMNKTLNASVQFVVV